MNRWGALALAGAGGTLLLVLGTEIRDATPWSDRGIRDGAASPVDRSLDAQVPEVGGQSADDAAGILARPLFNWNRRPGRSAAMAGTDESLPRLSGILIGANARYAIFTGAAGTKPLVLQEGGLVGRFTIDKIAADHVDVRSEAGSRTLRTRFSTAPPPPASLSPMSLPDAS